MLSRSSSNANDPLRRAKSTSSTHTSSSGHNRTVFATDPFVTRQHAEAAAVEAYNRARQCDRPTFQARRTLPPKLQRRRSQTTSRTEGSHLEDARLGRRRSTSTKGEANCGRPLQHCDKYHEVEGINGLGRKVITRKRSVIAPSSHTIQNQYHKASVSLSAARVRKIVSSDTDGSPAPRNGRTIKEQASTLQLSSLDFRQPDGCCDNVPHSLDVGESTNAAMQDIEPLRSSVPEPQTSEDIRAMARNRCLLDFHQRKVRGRKSMFLAPFQRHKLASAQGSSSTAYDSFLPPFNYADEPTMAPLPPALELASTPSQVLMPNKKSWSISDSLRSRIKRVFSKAPTAPAGLPVQQVDATRVHYAARKEVRGSPSENGPDPFVTVTRLAPAASCKKNSNSSNSRLSASQLSEAKSRVTSWTDSTGPATCSTLPDDDEQLHVDTQGTLKRSDSLRTLRKASSFFGRPVRYKLCRVSKPNPGTPEKTEKLFSALQERIKLPTRKADPDSAADREPQSQPRTPSESLLLPPQKQMHPALPNPSQRVAPSVRAVVSDPFYQMTKMPSPIAEDLSPDAAGTTTFLSGQTESVEATPVSQLCRRPAMKAAPPSQKQVAQRMERSENRWQSPLDELSPLAPCSTRATMMDDNPYELRSLSQSHRQPSPKNDLPHHAKVNQQPPIDRQAMLSPSIYSRAADDDSPRSTTPVEQTGVLVTITGREVRKYDISPKKAEPPKQNASNEWRRWVSGEMKSFSGGEEIFMPPKWISKESVPGTLAESRAASASALRPDSNSPGLDAQPPMTAIQRSRVTSRRSSFMNERYPMIETGRNSSDKSIGARRMPSRSTDRSISVEQNAAFAKRPSADIQVQKHSLTRQRVITGRHSVSQLGSAARNRSSQNLVQAKQDTACAENVLDDPRPPTASDRATLPSQNRAQAAGRPQSAFDLRANYKKGNNATAKPLEVRRKAIHGLNHSILEDTTIQNIAAGPYAFQSFCSSENKENTPPPDTATLPALSSSEWLAAGANKTRKLDAIQPTYKHRTVSRSSPGRNCLVADGKGSPAQRMATEFLERRSRENTPAFV